MRLVQKGHCLHLFLYLPPLLAALAKKKKQVNTVKVSVAANFARPSPGNTKGRSIPVPLTSCLTGSESAV
jgi:hypothetical protein